MQQWLEPLVKILHTIVPPVSLPPTPTPTRVIILRTNTTPPPRTTRDGAIGLLQ